MKPLVWWPVYQERDKSCLISAQKISLFHYVFVWRDEFLKELKNLKLPMKEKLKIKWQSLLMGMQHSHFILPQEQKFGNVSET